MSTANKTASTLASGREKVSEIKAPPGHGRVIKDNPAWAWVVLAVFGGFLALGLYCERAHIAHDLAIKQAAFDAGERVGACRMYREAFAASPILALSPKKRALDTACAPVMGGNLHQ